MVEIEGKRRTSLTVDCTVEISAGNAVSGDTFYLEPGETLEIRDDDPNRVKITVKEVDG